MINLNFDFKNPKGPLIIEQYARWQILSWVLTFRLVSKPLSKIYPDLASLQSAGEVKRINQFPAFFLKFNFSFHVTKDY
jgi:hypothetical protein